MIGLNVITGILGLRIVVIMVGIKDFLFFLVHVQGVSNCCRVND